MATQKDLLSRLADAGEEAIQRLAELPGANRFVDTANTLRDRVDELQKKVRGIDELEKRVARLEKQLATLTKAEKPKAASSDTRARKPSAKKPTS
jgi:hypothetical protein